MSLPQLPDALDAVGGLVILGLDADGVVTRASSEATRIQAQSTGAAWQLLTQPTFTDLLKRIPDASGIVHTGLVTLGDPEGEMRSLSGVIYRNDSQLLCVLGYNADELERMAKALLAMNDELDSAQRALVRANREITLVSLTDALTGVGNRRRFDEVLEREVARSARYGSPLSLVLLDLDRFKRINDDHGHQVGDEVLKAIGGLLAQAVRETDLVARSGGEEFAVIMPGQPLDTALKAAERLRTVIASAPVAGIEGVTASFGVTTLGDGDGPASLYRRADSALYAAKNAGRNRVVSDNAPL